ncbi:cytochrome c family protein [Thalassovita sp.]|uniref:c-type cytochrome n=1 Tax=Thalassovita sp. TaxID=1979401 RepID=UPI0029DE9044|nr:cytochrome c family protein [Thalassovita sp.]
MKKVLIATAALLSLAAPALAGDAAEGENVFKKCKACHQVGEGAKNKTGPVLNGVIGRTLGTAEDFKYSKSMIEMGEAGTIWTDENLATYLAKPKDFVPKTKMSFAGLKKDEDIANVIAYLHTFSE